MALGVMVRSSPRRSGSRRVARTDSSRAVAALVAEIAPEEVSRSVYEDDADGDDLGRLARLMGVSRRSCELWLAGSKPSGMARAFLSVLRQLADAGVVLRRLAGGEVLLRVRWPAGYPNLVSLDELADAWLDAKDGPSRISGPPE